MKKWTAILLALVLLLSLAACEQDQGNPDQLITRGPDTTTVADQDGTTPAPTADGTQEDKPYAFLSGNVELVPGSPFDPSVLPQPESTYEVPSCAIEGTDLVYNYGSFEVTAFRDKSGDVIYSIFLIDPNLPTAEGLLLGDNQSRVTELYGNDYTVDGTGWTYTSQGTQLAIIFQDGNVVSIEYRMVTE